MPQLVGRDEELAAVLRVLDAPELLPGVAVLSGEAGIGKTALWLAGIDAAAAAGYRVMSARPSEAETTFSFAGLTDLLGNTAADVLPELPPIADFVPGYEAINWWGIAAPKATARDVIDKLNREINAAFADPKIKARLFDLGGPPLAGSPSDFGKLIADETEKWSKVIREANIKL